MTAELGSHIVAIVVSFGVGLPILARGWKRQDLPVALLGAAVTLDGLEWLFWMIAVFTPASGTALGDAFASASRLAVDASILCMLLFTHIVFRPHSPFAGIAVWLFGGAMAWGFFGSAMMGDWGGWRNDHPWVWLEVVSQTLAYGWAAAEPLAHYVKHRRRLPYGLADPLVANRFLLWGVYAAMFCLTQTGYCLTLALYEDLTTLDTLLVALTVLGEVALWFALFPPRRYACWLVSRGGAGVGAHSGIRRHCS